MNDSIIVALMIATVVVAALPFVWVAFRNGDKRKTDQAKSIKSIDPARRQFAFFALYPTGVTVLLILIPSFCRGTFILPSTQTLFVLTPLFLFYFWAAVRWWRVAFRKDASISWTDVAVTGPTFRIWSPFAAPVRTLSFSELVKGGFEGGIYFVSGPSKEYLYWSALYQGYPALADAIRSKRPDLFEDS